MTSGYWKPFPLPERRHLKKLAKAAIAEDLGHGDITTDAIIPVGRKAHAYIIAKDDGILAGIPLAREVLLQLDRHSRIHALAHEGQAVRKGQRIADIHGELRAILTGERVMLNFLSQLSGTATMTRAFVRRTGRHSVSVLDTRKTTPLLRTVEKYAVRVGGGKNHRLTLSDAVLIKDNHIDAAGSVARAVRLVRRSLGHRHTIIQVEAQSLDQVREALAAKVHAIMLDNMSSAHMRLALKLARGKAKVEISGGVTLKTVEKYAKLKPDYISAGALTHSAPALDFSLEIVKR
jgi:nicotinate-nucleotide pyrophosphorylase (carboxylating)